MQVYVHYAHLSEAQKANIGQTEEKWLDNEAGYNSYYFFEGDRYVASMFTKWTEHENTIHVMWADIPPTRHDVYLHFLHKLREEGYTPNTKVSSTGFYTQGHPELCNRLNTLFKLGFRIQNLSWANLEMIRVTTEITLTQ